MNFFLPTAAGFRLIFRRPSIPLAEIAWRWSVAAAGWLLCSAFLVEYADTLSVNKVDRLLLGSKQAALILRALHRIFHGSALRFTQSGILLAIAIMLAWIFVGSFGRTAILTAMAEEFGIRLTPGSTITSLIGLNFLRAAVTLAGAVAAVGAALIASGVWASTHLSASGAARLWLALLFLVWLAWAAVNWSLSVGSVFVVKDGRPSLGAVAAAVRWCREHLATVIITGIWFGLAHGGAFIIAYGASFTVLNAAEALGTGPTLLLEFLIVCVYCMAADFLYTGRLAAYLAIAGGEAASNLLQESRGRPGPDAVDQSEIILSDLPLPAI
jgi:hypothetical protein